MRHVWAIAALAACVPSINVGSDMTADGSGGACMLVAPSPVDCPATPWGAPLSFTSVDDLQQKLIGRWAFCGGELRYSGRGPISGLPAGAGIELFSDSGALHYAWLQGSALPLIRAQEPGATGTVQLSLDQGHGRATLVAGDGVSAAWMLDVFADPRVLQNSAFDVWNFVAMP
jgi:hypothetical protein